MAIVPPPATPLPAQDNPVNKLCWLAGKHNTYVHCTDLVSLDTYSVTAVAFGDGEPVGGVEHALRHELHVLGEFVPKLWTRALFEPANDDFFNPLVDPYQDYEGEDYNMDHLLETPSPRKRPRVDVLQ
jgi:hypothetical protein